MATGREYDMDEVAKHNAPTDLWVASRGKVFDVTRFVGRHPGGSDVLVSHAGQDVTEVMADTDSHRHSKCAYELLDEYYIGDLRDATPDQQNSFNQRSQVEAVKSQNGGTSQLQNGKQKENSSVDKDGDLEVDIDIRKPMFWQVGKLGKHYQSWIHSPIDQDLRFFASDFLESLTTCQWYVVPIVWIPTMFLFIYLSYQNFAEVKTEAIFSQLAGGVSVQVFHMPLIFLAGSLIWTFMEYIIHRWVFHLNPPHWSKALMTVHFLFHGQHHKNPMNKDRLVFPPVPASFLAFPIYHIYMALFPRATAMCIIAGTILGYVYYDLMHYYLHHGSPSISYLKDLKKYHINHHYVEQQKGFGISSKLWDFPFNTRPAKYGERKTK